MLWRGSLFPLGRVVAVKPEVGVLLVYLSIAAVTATYGFALAASHFEARNAGQPKVTKGSCPSTRCLACVWPSCLRGQEDQKPEQDQNLPAAYRPTYLCRPPRFLSPLPSLRGCEKDRRALLGDLAPVL
ncbi:hypothetical protein EX349_07940 [Pseudomonas protegens]|nr:hypothetical protein [Pseudomonas protegens]NUE74419.1 hypothetical protein [Pseudomonas protegens]